MNDLEDITREKDRYSQGMDKMNEVFDEILPFKVFHDFQAEKHGGSHLTTLAGRFVKKELAEDFIAYQATIHPEILYVLEEAVKPPQQQRTKEENPLEKPKKEALSRIMGKVR